MPSATLQSWQHILTTQRKPRSVQTKGRVYEKWTRQVQLEHMICNSPPQTKFGLWYWICSAKSAQWIHVKWAAAAKTPLHALVLLRPTFRRPTSSSDSSWYSETWLVNWWAHGVAGGHVGRGTVCRLAAPSHFSNWEKLRIGLTPTFVRIILLLHVSS